MSILSKWWKEESTKVILKAALKILKVLAFGVGEELWKVATEEVAKAEAMPISGTNKAVIVVQAIKARFPEIKSYIANLATELAVAFLKESLIKK